MNLRVGSLCTGTGGLDAGVTAVLDAELAWVCDNDPAAAALLAHHYPDIPNHGDLTATDWARVDPVDVLTAGFPCQPFSVAGKRRGSTDERWLWDDIADAIRELRPGLVFLENVPGLLTAPGRQPDCVCGWHLRWGRLLADLVHDDQRPTSLLADDDRPDVQPASTERAEIGVRRPTDHGEKEEAGVCGDASMGTLGGPHPLPAASHGPIPTGQDDASPDHRRPTQPEVAALGERPRDRLGARRCRDLGSGEGPDLETEHQGDGGNGRFGCPACGRPMDDPSQRFVRRAMGDILGSLARLGFDAFWVRLPASAVGAPHRRERIFIVARPTADSAGAGRGLRVRVDVGEDGASQDARAAQTEPGRRDSAAPDPDGGAVREQPVPEPGSSGAAGAGPDRQAAPDAAGDGWREGRPEPARVVGGPDAAVGGDVAPDWAGYRPAIRRWERILGRPAPAPTVLGRRGGRQLGPAFVEWLQGLPEGWVTDVPGLSRNQQLKLLGNGCVPLQCEAALRHLLPLLTEMGVAA